MLNVAIVEQEILHLPISMGLEFSDRCKIVALCDIFPEKAEAMKKSIIWNVRFLMTTRRCWLPS